MGKRYSKEEKFLLLAGLRYGEKTGISKTKLAWVLASILGRADSTIYSQLSNMGSTEGKIPDKVWSLLNLEAEAEAPAVVEEDMRIADDTLEQHVGEIVKARVVALKSFGALCVVADTTRTVLLHVSEMANEYVDDVSAYLAEGDEVLAMLIMNKATDRLALSTRSIGSVSRKLPQNMDQISQFAQA